MAYRDVILADTPKAYWPLTTLVDAAPGGLHPLTVVSGFTDAFASEGALLGRADPTGRLFTNASQRLQRAHHADFNGLVYSVEFWIKPTVAGGSHRNIMVKGDGSLIGRAPGVWLSPSTNKIYLRHHASAAPGSEIGTESVRALPQDTWTHVVVTGSGNAGVMQIYLDGVLDIQISHTFTLSTNTSPFNINNDAQALGALDEVAYYNYVLSANRIAAHYEAGLRDGFGSPYKQVVVASRPRAYWSSAQDGGAVYDETHNSATLNFTPSGLPGLVTWLDAERVRDRIADGATLGGGIGAADSSGTTAWTPFNGGGTFRHNGVNGKAFFEVFSSGASLRWAQNLPAPCTVIYVARMKGTANGRVLAGISNNWLLGYHNGYENEGYFEPHWTYGQNNPANGSALVSALSPPPIRAWSFRSDNSTVAAMWRDTTRLTAIAGSTGVRVGPNGLTLTGYVVGGATTEFSNAEVYEVICYNRALSDAEMGSVQGYLGQKYGHMLSGFTTRQSSPVSDGESLSWRAGPSYAQIPDHPRLRLAGPMTAEFWIYPTSAIRTNVMQKSNFNFEFSIERRAIGTLVAYWGDGVNFNNLDTVAGQGAPINKWTHVAFVRGSSWETTFWVIDGEPYRPGSGISFGHNSLGPGGLFMPGTASTGILQVGNGFVNKPFEGMLAEVALYPRALGVAEIRSHLETQLRQGLPFPSGGYGG